MMNKQQLISQDLMRYSVPLSHPRVLDIFRPPTLEDDMHPLAMGWWEHAGWRSGQRQLATWKN